MRSLFTSIALCLFLLTSIGSYSSTYAQSIEKSKTNLSISTDKPTYVIGEKVTVRFGLNPIDTNKALEISISDPNKVILKTASALPEQDGSISYAFELLRGAQSGRWRINATYMDTVESLEFSVLATNRTEVSPASAIVSPPLILLTDRPSYTAGDNATIGIVVRQDLHPDEGIVNIAITGPDGKKYLEQGVLPHDNGLAQVEFEIVENHPIGNWSLSGTYMDVNVTIPFSVFEPTSDSSVLTTATINATTMINPSLILDKSKYNVGDTVLLQGISPPTSNITIRVVDPKGDIYLEGSLQSLRSNGSFTFPIHLDKAVNPGNWSTYFTNENVTRQIKFEVSPNVEKALTGPVISAKKLARGEVLARNLQNNITLLSFTNTGNSNVSSIIIKVNQGSIPSVIAEEGWKVEKIADDVVFVTSNKTLGPNQSVNMTLDLKDMSPLPTNTNMPVSSAGDQTGPLTVIPLPKPLGPLTVPTDHAQVTLNVTFSGEGSGRVMFVLPEHKECRSDSADICSIQFLPDQIQSRAGNVAMYAWPDDGSFFGGWAGGCGPRDDDVFNGYIDRDTNCTAIFTRGNMHINVQGSGIGAVFSTADQIKCATDGVGICSFGFFPGTTLALFAVAASGSRFAGWSGDDCSGTQQNIEIVINVDRTCTATFEAEEAPPVSRKPVIPEFVRISRILADRQHIDIGWPDSSDSTRDSIAHFQLFREKGSPFRNSMEMYTTNEGETCIAVSHTPFTTPYWYDEYWAYDDIDLGHRMQLRSWANDNRTFADFRGVRELGINNNPSLWPPSFDPNVYPPGRGPAPQWFVRCAIDAELITNDIPYDTEPSLSNAAAFCNWEKATGSNNGIIGNGPPEWAMIHAQYDQIMPLGWLPDTATGIVTNSFLAGKDAIFTHWRWPGPSYWLGVPPEPFHLGNCNPREEPPSLPIDEWFSSSGQLCNDWNGQIHLDRQYEQLLNPTAGERDHLVVENEQWLVPNGYRPEPGDRAYMVGRLIADCGEDFHTELHPLELIVSSYLQTGPLSTIDNGNPGAFPSTRNMPLISHRWQELTGGNPATINKVVVTSYWQGERLEFDLWPPPRPSDTAELHWMPEPGITSPEGVAKIEWMPLDNPDHLHVVVYVSPRSCIFLPVSDITRCADEMEFGTSRGIACPLHCPWPPYLTGDVKPKIDRRIVNAFMLWWQDEFPLRPSVDITIVSAIDGNNQVLTHGATTSSRSASFGMNIFVQGFQPHPTVDTKCSLDGEPLTDCVGPPTSSGCSAPIDNPRFSTCNAGESAEYDNLESGRHSFRYEGFIDGNSVPFKIVTFDWIISQE